MSSEWSIPESEVLSRALTAIEEEQDAVIATVIDIKGSAYRRPGAKMLITPDGGVGSITAGCLEDDIESLARDVLNEGEPRVETYDLMNDDDVWGLGVGCNGVIDIFIEPLDSSYLPILEAHSVGKSIGNITIINGNQKGDRGYYTPQEGVTGFPDDLASTLKSAAAELLTQEGADTFEVNSNGETIEVFIDSISPPPELVILGSGHDVDPVVELAHRAGFRVTVIGFRGAANDKGRFRNADAVKTTSPSQVCQEHDFNDQTYAIVMTHNFVDDRLAIDELLKSPVPYIGLMGPQGRFENMLEEFEKEEQPITDAELDTVYTPAGLDLGGGTPYQIGLSIISEVLAVHNERTPRHLKAREGYIHDRVKVDSDD